jgi:uncharacterized protein with GYD domain
MITTITLARFRRRLTAEDVQRTPKIIQEGGGKILSAYWTFGRFDAVITIEWANEKVAMGTLSKLLDVAASETLIAIPREEAVKLAGY